MILLACPDQLVPLFEDSRAELRTSYGTNLVQKLAARFLVIQRRLPHLLQVAPLAVREIVPLAVHLVLQERLRDVFELGLVTDNVSLGWRSPGLLALLVVRDVPPVVRVGTHIGIGRLPITSPSALVDRLLALAPRRFNRCIVQQLRHVVALRRVSGIIDAEVASSAGGVSQLVLAEALVSSAAIHRRLIVIEALIDAPVAKATVRY